MSYGEAMELAFEGSLRAQGTLWATASKNMGMSVLQPQWTEFCQQPEWAWKRHWTLADSTALKTPWFQSFASVKSRGLG